MNNEEMLKEFERCLQASDQVANQSILNLWLECFYLRHLMMRICGHIKGIDEERMSVYSEQARKTAIAEIKQKFPNVKEVSINLD